MPGAALFVLDASTTLAWFFRDEDSPAADLALAALSEGAAVVPSIWALEVGNVLWQAERRGRALRADVDDFFDLLAKLPIEVDRSSSDPPVAFGACARLARERGLTTYDASYLELAAKLGLPIATLDRKLADAAKSMSVEVFAG